jgi:FkbM family methyltransferase
MRKRLRFIGKFRVKAADGKQFYLYNNGFYLETSIFWLGLEQFPWENMTRRLWTHLCPLSSTIFDIGANSGIYATLAKAYHPEATVVAFEPQPNIFAVLRKNSAVNNFDIQCENFALSNQEGLLPFYNYGQNTFTTGNTTAGSLNKDWQPGDDWQPDFHQCITVPVKKLARYVEENSIKKIDLIKLDVETLEYEVLSGLGEYLYSHQPLIILEVQDQAIGERIKELFATTCYTFYHIDEQTGLREVKSLGLSGENKNYLLCPPASRQHIQAFRYDTEISPS